MASPSDRIPVSIVTGFLGAGKSTLLNRLLRDPEMRDTAVIINEFGEVGIDHLLVESSGDAMIELSNGCLCCTVRGELTDTLASLRQDVGTGRVKALRRVVIETSGLADPAPVIQSIIGAAEISRDYSVDGVITLVDAVSGLSTLDHHEEARRQAAMADKLVLTKKTLCSYAALAPLRERLRQLNPLAPLIDGDDPVAAGHAVLICGLYDPSSKIPDVARWLHDEAAHDHHDHGHDHDHGHHHHDDGIRAFSIIHDRPVDPAAIGMFVDLLRSAHAEKLLRMKAVVQLADDPERPLVLHGVQSVFHQPERLERWPDPSDRRTRMVLITRDLPAEFVQSLFDAFTGTPRIDQADRQALEANPLAIPGMRF